MNRRGFLKCIALTPLVGLLKPKKQVQWIIPKGGIKQCHGMKYPVYSTPESEISYKKWQEEHDQIWFKTVDHWQGHIDIKKYRQAIRTSDANISNIGT